MAAACRRRPLRLPLGETGWTSARPRATSGNLRPARGQRRRRCASASARAGWRSTSRRGPRPGDPAGGARARRAVAAGARVGSLVVLGGDVSVGAGSTVERSVVLDGAGSARAAAARLHRLRRRRVGDATKVTGGAALGEGVRIGADNVVTRGARIFPGVNLPDERCSYEPADAIPICKVPPEHHGRGRQRWQPSPTATTHPGGVRATRAAIARSTYPTSSATSSRCPSICGTRSGGPSRRS